MTTTENSRADALTDEQILALARHHAIDHKDWSPERCVSFSRALLAASSDRQEPREAGSIPRVHGVSRVHDNPCAVLVLLKAEPTDDALRAIHDSLTCQPEPRAEATLTAIDADMVWRDEDGESFHHSIDDAVDAEVDQAYPDTEQFEMRLTLAKRIPTARVRVFNITESGYEWEIVDAARTGASS